MPEGSVAFWHTEEGWGGIVAPAHPGTGFVHFSHVRMDGYRELVPGETVEYEWGDDLGQDGCQWRVAWVKPMGRGRVG